MHQYQEIAKNFLGPYVVGIRESKHLKKSAMSTWLQIDPRSYSEIEKGRYCLSAASLLCFQSKLDDAELLDMLHQFRAIVESKGG